MLPSWDGAVDWAQIQAGARKKRHKYRFKRAHLRFIGEQSFREQVNQPDNRSLTRSKVWS
jgi:hypothetical protein